MTKIKGCPWCGCAPASEHSMNRKRWTVWCPNEECHGIAEVYGNTKKAAIAAWNRRAGEDKP